MNTINRKQFAIWPILACISMSLFLFSSNLVQGSAGSIAKSDGYPEDGGEYLAVDHFTYQLTEVNVNATVSVSIDNGPLISMIYQGIKNEASGNKTDCPWHTWQLAVPAITTPGKHTFQFFSDYYVWQDKDNFWAKFSACTEPKFFTIDKPSLLAAIVAQESLTATYVAAALAVGLAAIFLLTLVRRPQKAGVETMT
jgi:hypothetical protein